MPYPKQTLPKGRSSNSTHSKNDDPRFKALQTDPRFRLPSRKNTHTKLDKRFARVLKDDDFSRKASVDKYGRKLDKAAGRKELERLYSLEDDEDEDEDEEGQDDDMDVLRELKRVGNGYDPSRDGGFSESSSSEDDSSEEEEEDESAALEEADINDEGANAIPLGEVSSRIAAVNLDWDNVRAVDLMAVASSFTPADGRIISVAVYPSEFGRERMEREEMEGPPREIFTNGKEREQSVEEDDDTSDEDERIKKDMLREDKGEEFDSSALRRYQIDRLRYYYAIIHCSSATVAKQVYDDMDGKEYLSSANFFDLRFVPDDVSFDEEKPRDVCESTPADYKPTEFVTDALTHSKVKLTWDAEDKQRKEVQKRAFSRREIDENDLQAYLGSASSSSEGEESEQELPFANGDFDDAVSITSKSTVNKQGRRDALRAALGLDSETAPKKTRKDKKDQGPVGDLQISFTPGLSVTKDTNTSVFENDPREIEESTLDKYVRRERERKSRRKEKAKVKREGKDLSEDEAGDAERVKVVAEDVQGEDDGFEDAFFTDPLQAEKDARKNRKAEKARIKAERTEQDKLSVKKRAELELLLAGDGEEDAVRHFDMREIEKQEKNKNGKKKNRKSKKGLDLNEEAEGQKELFKVDVQDERFSSLFENHEFAIDPTNPRFRKTEGMRAFVEEGRRKKHDLSRVEKTGQKRARDEDDSVVGLTVVGDDVTKLVEKVKKKMKT